MDYNFEEGVEKLLQSQRKTKKSLCDAMGLTRQGFTTKLKNKTVYVKELAKMAEFFEMTEADLIASLTNKSVVSSSERNMGDDYLQKHLKDLEDRFVKLVDQLAVKDQQIAGLQRTVDALVGKSKGTPNRSRNHQPVHPRVQKKLGAVVA